VQYKGVWVEDTVWFQGMDMDRLFKLALGGFVG
jgi:hypothetical protein